MVLFLILFSAAASHAKLSSIDNKADYIIIFPGNLKCAALDGFVKWRSSKGLELMPVTLTEIYSEFKQDTITEAESIRDFISYALQAWQNPKPRFVLLLGGIGQIPSLKAKSDVQIGEDSIYIEEYFAESIYDSDHLPDLALGRISARDTSELAPIFNKIRRFEDELKPTDYLNDFLLLADSHDGTIMSQLAGSLKNNLLKNKRVEILENSINTDQQAEREVILSAIDDGNMFVVGYYHCNPKIWFYETQLKNRDFMNHIFKSNHSY